MQLLIALLFVFGVGVTTASKELVLVVLSDSLSDNGNGTFAASNYTQPSPSSYWNGRFSNGPVWNDYLLSHPFDRVINYAYGGASACPSSNTSGPPPGFNGSRVQPADVLNQTRQYLSQSQPDLARAGAKRVVVVWIGGNDLMQASQIGSSDKSSLTAALDTLVCCVNQSLTLLLEAGETHVVVGMPTVFGIGTQNQKARAVSLSLMDSAAAKLLPVLKKLNASYPPARLGIWDVANYTKRLALLDPATFGFLNNTGPCLKENNPPGPSRDRRLLPNLQCRPGSAAGSSSGWGKRIFRSKASCSGAHEAVAARDALQVLAQQRPADQRIAAAHCADPDGYLYWDGAHPTTGTHLLLARHLLRDMEVAQMFS